MDIVQKITRKYNTRNPFELAAELNIIVLYENLGSINGYYNRAYRQKFIHINENIPVHLQEFVAAHELGHAILHPNSCTPFLRNSTLLSVDKLEIEANTFAVHLLIPDEELEEYYQYTLSQIACVYGYNEKLIELRVKNNT